MHHVIALQSALDARQERRSDRRRAGALRHASEDAVRKQHGVQLARHVRREVDYAAAIEVRPLAVRSGKHGEDRDLVGAERADKLSLFAAHDVGRAVTIARDEPRNDRERCILHCDDAVSERVERGRTFDVRRLDPSLAAADHSACQSRGGIRTPIPQ